VLPLSSRRYGGGPLVKINIEVSFLESLRLMEAGEMATSDSVQGEII